MARNEPVRREGPTRAPASERGWTRTVRRDPVPADFFTLFYRMTAAAIAGASGLAVGVFCGLLVQWQVTCSVLVIEALVVVLFVSFAEYLRDRVYERHVDRHTITIYQLRFATDETQSPIGPPDHHFALAEPGDLVKSPYFFFPKRVIDLCLALALFVFLFPQFLLIIVAIKLDSPGPALVRLRRLGRHGREITLLGFRTMYLDAETRRRAALSSNHAANIVEDPRITRIGSYLRRWSLDKLPQLWNVIRGDLSFVGPMPWPSTMEGKVSHSLLSVRPGLVEVAEQSLGFEEARRQELEYLATAWLPTDLGILARRFRSLFLQDTRR